MIADGHHRTLMQGSISSLTPPGYAGSGMRNHGVIEDFTVKESVFVASVQCNQLKKPTLECTPGGQFGTVETLGRKTYQAILRWSNVL